MKSEEVAALLAYLASDIAAMITGANVLIGSFPAPGVLSVYGQFR
ncbi:UNVERIFIED_ORG: hypothetical protein ABIB52_004524 [Arthrobacter sp. UYCu721]